MSFLRRAFLPTAALAALTLSPHCSNVALAASDAAPAMKPARIWTVGSMRVERYGGGSPTMIFIPGLTSGSWVWRDAVPTYATTHAVYLVTLAGFDGLPRVPRSTPPMRRYFN